MLRLSLSLLTLSALVACSGGEVEPAGDDTDGGHESDTDTDSDSDADAIYDVQSGAVATGTVVTGEGLVASDEDGSGFFLQSVDGTGEYSGIWVYTDTDGEDVGVSRRDLVSFSATYEEYVTGKSGDSLSELVVTSVGDVTVLSSGNALHAAVELTVDQASTDATAEPYEGVLVIVKNVTVTNPDLDYGEWELDGKLAVDDALYGYEGTLTNGKTFTSITGFLHWSYDAWKLEPRDASDFVE